MRLLPLPLLVSVVLAPPAWAQVAFDPPLERLRSLIERDPDGFLSQSLAELFRAAPDGRLTAARVETLRAVEAAARRAQGLAQLLSYDLDGDLAVSAAEIEALREALAGERRAELETVAALADADGDGALSTAELAARAAMQEDRGGGRSGQLDALLAFDLDGDEAVTVDELQEAVRRVVAGERLDGACDLPAPSARAQVVLLSGYEGTALSTVAVAGPDEPTTAARIAVDPGSEPLYVILTSFGSVLWSFEGETGRIERVVAGIAAADVGVAGVARERVTFVPTDGCLPGWIEEEGEAARQAAAAFAAQRLGRDVDRVIAAYSVGEVALPGGEARDPPGADALLGDLIARAEAWAGEDPARRAAVESEARDARRFHPGGLLAVDPAAVAAPRAAQAYEVLPQNPGMLQLLASGALEPVGDAYRIARPIPRFPPGLGGAHREEFLLAPGVPRPAGTPGHSGVVDEATGECVTGAICLGR